MTRDNDDSIVSLGFEELEATETARIVISKRAMKEHRGLDVRAKARLKRVLQRWCKGQALTEEMMNPSEGRTSKHKEMIQAFKVFKVRLYGFVRKIGMRQTFFIVDVDPAKKQDKAGPTLERAKKRADGALDDLIKMEKE